MMKNIFVTIGSTRFDTFINELLQPETLNILSDRGCQTLTVQHGNYSNLEQLNNLKDTWKKFELLFFDYMPSIEPFLKSADFVIGHAGAGTVLETLRNHKPLLIIVNDTLMDNHQQELALEMSSLNYAFMTYPYNLRETLKEINLQKLLPFPERKAELFSNFMNELLLTRK